MNVAITNSLDDLNVFLDSHQGPKPSFISFADDDLQALDLFARHGAINLARGKSPIDPDQFLNAYLDLVGKLSGQNNNRLWWATDIASKNRFTCKLPDYLQQLVEVMTVARTLKGAGCLIVYQASPIIVNALIEALQAEGFDASVSGKTKHGQRARRLKKILGLFYHGGRIYGRALASRIQLGLKLATLRTQGPWYIIKTFIYPSAFKSGCYADSFFGRLPSYLQEKNKTMILADISGEFLASLEKIKNCSEVIIPWESFIGLGDILKSIMEVLSCRFHVDDALTFMGLPVAGIVKEEIHGSLNGIQVYQLLHYNAMRRLLKHCQVKTLLMTYENNPWEKMETLAIKDHGAPIQVLGYQHATVAPGSINLFLGPQEMAIAPLPDKIITVGEITYGLMKQLGGYPDTQLVLGCALRYEYLSGLKAAGKPVRIKRIFLPLGGTTEVHAMVRYVLDQIGSNPDYEILIRAHPVLPWEELSRRYSFDLEKYPSVRISKNSSLMDDLNGAELIIYWETTVAIEGLCLGKPVIHFDMGSLLSFDPLDDLKDFKWAASKEKHLLDIINSVNQLQPQESHQQLSRAQAFIQRYFGPVTSPNLRLFEASK